MTNTTDTVSVTDLGSLRTRLINIFKVGQATITSGDTEIGITFDEPFTYQPIIILTPATPLRAWHWTDNQTPASFDIGISHPQRTDATFNWYAYGLLAEHIQINQTEGQRITDPIEPDPNIEDLQLDQTHPTHHNPSRANKYCFYFSNLYAEIKIIS